MKVNRITNNIRQNLETLDLETMSFSMSCSKNNFDISRNVEQKMWEVVFQNFLKFSVIVVKYLHLMVFLVNIILK